MRVLLLAAGRTGGPGAPIQAVRRSDYFIADWCKGAAAGWWAGMGCGMATFGGGAKIMSLVIERRPTMIPPSGSKDHPRKEKKKPKQPPKPKLGA